MVFFMTAMSFVLYMLIVLEKTRAAIIFGGILWVFLMGPLEKAAWQGFWQVHSCDRVSSILTTANYMGCIYVFIYFGLGLVCLFMPFAGQMIGDLCKYRKKQSKVFLAKGCLELLLIILLIPFIMRAKADI